MFFQINNFSIEFISIQINSCIWSKTGYVNSILIRHNFFKYSRYVMCKKCS